jgi:hypothetical protein
VPKAPELIVTDADDQTSGCRPIGRAAFATTSRASPI